MLELELLNENTNKIESLKITNEEKIDVLLNYFKNHQIKTIKCANYGVLVENLDWIIENKNPYDIPFLESLSVEELYDILEEVKYCDFNEMLKAQDIAEYEGISVFDVNINSFENSHYVFNSLEEYYDYCDEVLEETNSDFFNSKLSWYFDYDAYHNECEYDCSIMKNGYVIVD